MEKKIAKKDKFARIIAKYNLDEEDRITLEHEIELLEKKASKDRKPTAVQKENVAIKELTLSLMETDRLYTCGELAKIVDKEYAEKDISVNKMSALLKQMLESGLVTKTEEKRKSYFCKVQ